MKEKFISLLYWLLYKMGKGNKGEWNIQVIEQEYSAFGLEKEEVIYQEHINSLVINHINHFFPEFIFGEDKVYKLLISKVDVGDFEINIRNNHLVWRTYLT